MSHFGTEFSKAAVMHGHPSSRVHRAKSPAHDIRHSSTLHSPSCSGFAFVSIHCVEAALFPGASPSHGCLYSVFCTLFPDRGKALLSISKDSTDFVGLRALTQARLAECDPPDSLPRLML